MKFGGMSVRVGFVDEKNRMPCLDFFVNVGMVVVDECLICIHLPHQWS